MFSLLQDYSLIANLTTSIVIAVKAEDWCFQDVWTWGGGGTTTIFKCFFLGNDVMPVTSLLTFRPAGILVFAFQYKHSLNNYSWTAPVYTH